MTVYVYSDRADSHPTVYAGNISVVYNNDGLHDLVVYYGKKKEIWETAHVEFLYDGQVVKAYQEWETTDDA